MTIVPEKTFVSGARRDGLSDRSRQGVKTLFITYQDRGNAGDRVRSLGGHRRSFPVKNLMGKRKRIVCIHNGSARDRKERAR